MSEFNFNEHDLKTIRELAQTELENEAFREAVEKEKERLRTHRSWWERVFPYKITIERR